jgi:hypothetical protein
MILSQPVDKFEKKKMSNIGDKLRVRTEKRNGLLRMLNAKKFFTEIKQKMAICARIRFWNFRRMKRQKKRFELTGQNEAQEYAPKENRTMM